MRDASKMYIFSLRDARDLGRRQASTESSGSHGSSEFESSSIRYFKKKYIPPERSISLDLETETEIEKPKPLNIYQTVRETKKLSKLSRQSTINKWETKQLE